MGVVAVRVVVRGAGRRVELPLPAAAPIAELTPALVRLCQVRAGGDATPAAWILAPSGRPAIEPTASLAEAGVRDGDVLELVDAASWRTPAPLPLAALVGAAIDLGPRWTHEATAAVLAGATVTAAAVAAVTVARAGTSGSGGRPAVLLAAASLLAAAIALRPLPRLVATVVGLGRTRWRTRSAA